MTDNFDLEEYERIASRFPLPVRTLFAEVIASVVKLRERNERLERVVEAAKEFACNGHEQVCQSRREHFKYDECRCGLKDLESALKALDAEPDFDPNAIPPMQCCEVKDETDEEG